MLVMMFFFLQDRFIIPPKGKQTVFTRINDAWRRYKNYIRKNYFLKYPNLRERLKHRPKRVPGPDFKRLMLFWGNNIVQVRFYYIYLITILYFTTNL